MDLSERIKAILDEQGVSQSKFAKTLNIDPSYVSMLVHGERKRISTILAGLIEEKYNYSAKWVIDGIGEKISHKGNLNNREWLIEKVKKMEESSINAVLAYVKTLEGIEEGEPPPKE
jgi:transcriptional regulator with XRE-family HTH domain